MASVHVIRVEDWTVRNTPNSRIKGDRKVVTKIAVRVRKGAVGGNRPGTFHGATNFPQVTSNR